MTHDNKQPAIPTGGNMDAGEKAANELIERTHRLRDNLRKAQAERNALKGVLEALLTLHDEEVALKSGGVRRRMISGEGYTEEEWETAKSLKPRWSHAWDDARLTLRSAED